MIMSFCSNVATAQSVELTTEDNQSLAQITEEQVSLQDAMALALDIKPELYTRAMFHKDVVAYAAFIGIPYYNAATNGYNNIAILHANSKGYFTNPAVYNNVGAISDTHLLGTQLQQGASASKSVSLQGASCTNMVDYIDSTNMSPFQKEHYVKEGYTLIAGSYTVVANNGTVVEATSYNERMLEDKSYNSSSNTSTSVATSLTQGGDLLNAIELPNVPGVSLPNWSQSLLPSFDIVGPSSSPDTIFIVDTVTEVAPFCDCGEDVSLPTLWDKYMNLRKDIRKEKNAGQRALLIGCRIKIGTIVRSAKRYEVPVANNADKGTSSVPIYQSMPAEFCGRLTVSTSPKTTSSKGGSKGIAAVKAKLFWRGVAKWFKSIGACKRH
jgi:hypothetical protein